MPIVIPGEIEENLILISSNGTLHKFEGFSIEGVLNVLSICLSIDEDHCEYYYLVELEYGSVLNYIHNDSILNEENYYVLHIGFGSPTVREIQNNMLKKQKTRITADGYRVTIKPGKYGKNCQPNWLKPKVIGPMSVQLKSVSYRCGSGGSWWDVVIFAPKLMCVYNNEDNLKEKLSCC
ncbi:MAG TPA: hypothetical protein PLO25_00640 [Candidatus Saccharibacteria bacterium]|nr:hypothetical protein [Candidatus Saccharibacteria bacterium]